MAVCLESEALAVFVIEIKYSTAASEVQIGSDSTGTLSHVELAAVQWCGERKSPSRLIQVGMFTSDAARHYDSRSQRHVCTTLYGVNQS